MTKSFINKMDWLCNSTEGRDEMRKVRERLSNLDLYNKTISAWHRGENVSTRFIKKWLTTLEIAQKLVDSGFVPNDLNPEVDWSDIDNPTGYNGIHTLQEAVERNDPRVIEAVKYYNVLNSIPSIEDKRRA